MSAADRPGMGEVLVDVVAAAARAEQQQRGIPLESLTGIVPPLAVQQCPLGHQNGAGTRFCGACGLPIGDASIGQRVDLDAVREAVRPLGALDAEERARRDREHAEAIAANMRAELDVVSIEQQRDPSEKKIHIHFVSDGFTWGGKVWYAGDELEIGPEHPRWASALGWIRLTKREQVARYGRVFFDFGPYPYRNAPAGTEMLLPTAGVGQWATLRGGVPARQSPDGDGALIPR